MRKSHFTLSLTLIFALSACGLIPSPIPDGKPVTQDSPTASLDETVESGSIPGPTPFPINEEVISQAVVLEAPYLDLLEPLAELWPRQPFVTGMGFDPTTGLIVLGTGYTFDPLNDGFRGADGQTQIQFWDIRTNSARAIIDTGQDQEQFNSLAVSMDGNRIAFVGTERFLLASRVQGELSFSIEEFEIPDMLGNSLGSAFSPDGNLLAVIAEEGDIVLFDAITGDRLSTIQMDYPEELPGCLFNVHEVVFAAEGKTLLTVCNNNLQAWNIELPESPTIAFEMLIGNATTFILSPDGSYLVSGESEGALDIFQIPGGESLAHLAGHAYNVQSLAFSPDGSLLASASNDHIILWDTRNWNRLATLDAAATRMFFTPDGKFLVSQTYERGGRLWGLRGSSLTAERTGIKVVVIPGPFYSVDWTDTIPSNWLTPAGSLPLHEIHLSSGWGILETCTYDLNGFRRYVQRRQHHVRVEVSERESRKVLATKYFEGSLPGECPNQLMFSPTSFTETIDGDSPDAAQFFPWLHDVMAPLGYP